MKKRIGLILSILLVLIFGGIILAQTAEIIGNKLYRGYKAVSSTTKGIINTGGTAIDSSVTTVFEHNICQKVVNTSSAAIFVPTRSEDEWFSFRTNLPPNTTLQGCGCYNNLGCPSGQFCQGATSTGSPYCAGYYQSVDYYCGGKPIPQGSPPYVCSINNSPPYSLIEESEGGCPSGKTLGFIQGGEIFGAGETFCSSVGITSLDGSFELPNCKYKCDLYTTQTACQAESSFCSWLSMTTSSSCSSLKTQTTCQSKNGCTRNSGGTPIPGTCVVQTCGSAHGQTYSSLSITSPDLCNGGSATNFVTNTSNWTWKCGTASCSANKTTTITPAKCDIGFAYETGSVCEPPTKCYRDTHTDPGCCCPRIQLDPECTCPSTALLSACDGSAGVFYGSPQNADGTADCCCKISPTGGGL